MSRLQLMIIMAKAYLKGYPFGGHRTNAVRNNTARLSTALKDWASYKANFSAAEGKTTSPNMDHILFQRIKLLLVMSASFAEGNPMGASRKRALENNIDYIAESLNLEKRSETIPVLSVA